MAVDLNIMSKSGAWFGYQGQKIGQGRDNAREYLKAHPEVMAEIEDKIRELKGIKGKAKAAENKSAVDAAPEEANLL